MDTKYNRILEKNWQYIAGSLYEAADYIGEKFPDSEAAKEFAKNNRFIHSRDRMQSNPYVWDIRSRKLVDHILEHCGNGFAHFQDFFLFEARNVKDPKDHSDPARAAKIYKQLSHWGCFKADMAAQKRLPVQDMLDDYLKQNQTSVTMNPAFNTIAKPDFFRSGYMLDYKDDEDASDHLNKSVNALLALADAHGRLDDINVLFYDLDRDTGKAYIEILSENNFSDLLGIVCRKGAHSNSSVMLNIPDAPPQQKKQPAAPDIIKKTPTAAPLKRRKRPK